MSRKDLEVPKPSSPTRIMQSLKARKKLERISFRLSQRHDVAVSASYILDKLAMDADEERTIAELAEAAK